MSSKYESQRLVVADLQAPVETLTDAETNAVKGGNFTLLVTSFKVGYNVAKALGADKLGEKIGDWAYNKFGKK